MKINKLLFKTLFLYFSIFFVLFLAFYLMFPFNFEKYIFAIFLNTFFNIFIFYFSIFIIYKNAKKGKKLISNLHFNNSIENKSNNYINKIMYCSDVIYWICKNIPFILYFLGIIIPIFISTIFKEKIIFIFSLLSIFAINIFYIFSRRIF